MASSSAYSRSSAATLSLVLAMLPLSRAVAGGRWRIDLPRVRSTAHRPRWGGLLGGLGSRGLRRRGRGAEPDRQDEQDQQQGRAGEDVGVAPQQLEAVPVVLDVPRQVAVVAEQDRDGVGLRRQ